MDCNVKLGEAGSVLCGPYDFWRGLRQQLGQPVYMVPMVVGEQHHVEGPALFFKGRQHWRGLGGVDQSGGAVVVQQEGVVICKAGNGENFCHGWLLWGEIGGNGGALQARRYALRAAFLSKIKNACATRWRRGEGSACGEGVRAPFAGVSVYDAG